MNEIEITAGSWRSVTSIYGIWQKNVIIIYNEKLELISKQEISSGRV